MRQEGLAPIVTILLLASIFLLIPLPDYQNKTFCLPGMICPKEGWYLGDPLYKKIFNYFYSINRPTGSLVEIATPSTIPSTNLTSTFTEEAANWKTYINTQLGISFKYPNSWVTKSNDIASTYLHGVVALYPEGQEPQGPIPSAIAVSYWDNPDQLSLKDLDQKYSGGVGSPGLYSPIPQKVVGPVGPALYQTNANCEPVLCDRILIPYKDKVYVLTEYYNSVDDPNRKSQKEVLNQILSTFKFLP